MGTVAGRGFKLEGPTKRIAAASLLIVVLLAAAVGVTIWRSSVADDSRQVALEEISLVPVAEAARVALWRESAGVEGFAGNRAPDNLALFNRAHRELRASLDKLAANTRDNAQESAAVARAQRLASGLAGTATRRIFPLAPRGRRATVEATVTRFADQRDAIEGILSKLQDGFSAEAAAGKREADNATSEATTIGVIVGLLALLATIGLAAYVIRLVGQLLERVRITASGLTDAAMEMRSASIRAIITGVQDKTNATILATEQGSKQADETAALMTSTADVLEESIRATDQQKDAAQQVSSSIVEIRGAAQQLAAEQSQRLRTAEQMDELISDLERTLEEYGLAVDGRPAGREPAMRAP